jgi:hypothetical protein
LSILIGSLSNNSETTVAKQTFQLAQCGCTLRVSPQNTMSNDFMKKSFSYRAAFAWNNLPCDVVSDYESLVSLLQDLKI